MRKCAAAATALFFTLAACGGNPAPKPLPKPSASVSTTPSPSPPVLPEAAKAQTPEGAQAFVRHFASVIDYAGKAGDTAPLRVLFSESCDKCERLAAGVDDTYKNGGYIKGGDWTVRRLKFYSLANDQAVIDAFIDFTPQDFAAKAGATPQHFPIQPNVLKAFILAWSGDGWTVESLDKEL